MEPLAASIVPPDNVTLFMRIDAGSYSHMKNRLFDVLVQESDTLRSWTDFWSSTQRYKAQAADGLLSISRIARHNMSWKREEFYASFLDLIDVGAARPMAGSKGELSKDAPTNPRGIPFAPFVDKVEDYVTSRAEVESTLRSFQEMISCAVTMRAHVA
ncbi:MAG: hypothetical protein Q9165_002384 [Trypethelium subeluteriae]